MGNRDENGYHQAFGVFKKRNNNKPLVHLIGIDADSGTLGPTLKTHQRQAEVQEFIA